MIQLQQGDVTFEEASIHVSTFKRLKLGEGIVLAEGEVTGHKHRVREYTELLQAPDGTWFLYVPEGGATVIHEPGDANCHKPMPLSSGICIVSRKLFFSCVAEAFG